MSEIAIHQDQPTPTTDPTGGRLVAWATAAHAANLLAKSLCATTFAPKHFRDNPGDTTAAIIAGDELGLSPLAAMRSIYVIHGTPAIYTRTMVALVQSRGHEIWTDETSDAKVTVCGQRRGSARVEKATWTIDRARKAKYTSNEKYASNPQEMLYAKAAAEVCRKVAADVLLGIPSTVEDLELSEPEPTTTVTRAAAAVTRTVRRTPVVEPVEPPLDEYTPPEPAVEPEPAADEPVDVTDVDAVELILPQQLRKLHVLFGKAGYGNRDDGLAYLSMLLDREVTTSKDLTKAEASQAIDALVGLTEGPTP